MVLKCVWCWTCLWSDVSGKWHWIATMLWFWWNPTICGREYNKVVAQWWRIRLPIQDVPSIPASGRFLEKEMTTHSSVLACKIPWIEEPGRLQPTGITKESDTTYWLNKQAISVRLQQILTCMSVSQPRYVCGAGEGCHWWFALSSELSNV